MRVVITHTDLRIYWPARIAALQQALERRGDELYTIEIAGAGSPYAFAGVETGATRSVSSAEGSCLQNWLCLFPTSKMEEIPPARASRRLLAKLNELDPDIVLSGSIAYPSGAASVYWAKTHRKPVIIFDDAKPGHIQRGSLVNYIKRMIYGQVDAFFCPAYPWKEALRSWNLRPEQVFVGVDVVDNAFWADRGGNEALAARWSAPFLLAVGRQIEAKNFLFLLQVYERYRQVTHGRNCLPLVMVGDGPEREGIERFIRERGLQGVHLFPFADARILRSFYHQAAALVLPSRSETWGLVVNEAMAAGLPVMVSKECGCASVLVDEGVNGYTFCPYEQEELLQALVSFSEKNAEERAAMGRASRRLIHPWGLEQFVSGSLQAIDYAMVNKKTCRSIRARIVMQHWKGRYRPV